MRDQIRPFTNQVDGTVADLKRAAGPLNDSTTSLSGALRELNQALNALAFNPDGVSEGYLFYASWLNHNTNSLFLAQDGLGPMRRSILMYTCLTSTLADSLVATRPNLSTARDLIRLPTSPQICDAATTTSAPDVGGRDRDDVEGAGDSEPPGDPQTQPEEPTAPQDGSTTTTDETTTTTEETTSTDSTSTDPGGSGIDTTTPPAP